MSPLLHRYLQRARLGLNSEITQHCSLKSVRRKSLDRICGGIERWNGKIPRGAEKESGLRSHAAGGGVVVPIEGLVRPKDGPPESPNPSRGWTTVSLGRRVVLSYFTGNQVELGPSTRMVGKRRKSLGLHKLDYRLRCDTRRQKRGMNFAAEQFTCRVRKRLFKAPQHGVLVTFHIDLHRARDGKCFVVDKPVTLDNLDGLRLTRLVGATFAGNKGWAFSSLDEKLPGLIRVTKALLVHPDIR